jgi:DNA-binding MarR family transcriptional regulator
VRIFRAVYHQRMTDHGPGRSADAVGTRQEAYAAELELATRGLLALNVVVLEETAKRVGLAPLRALQSLERLGPSLVTEMGSDLDLPPSSASRLSDRLAESGLITRAVAPHNRRATVLELTAAGRAILDELIGHRVAQFRAVTDEMKPDDREALLRGAAAFTTEYRRLTEHETTSKADGE